MLFQLGRNIVIQLVEHAGDSGLYLRRRHAGLQLIAERIEQQLLLPRLARGNQPRDPVPRRQRFGELRLGLGGMDA